MDDFESVQYKIKPGSLFKIYDDIEDAYRDFADFTDIAVNSVTDIGGYTGVISTKAVFDIDYYSEKAMTTVYVYLEKDRKTEASPYG